MACVTGVSSNGIVPMGSGMRLVSGTINIGTYATGGAALNLANYLESGSYPFFIGFAGGGNISSKGFMLPSHNGGTIDGGTVKMVQSGAATDGLGECNNSKDLATVQIRFCCIGKAP